jgi:subtilisin-like proprotein convertase family protein/V8-like Glu-specific endopeptidase
MDGSALCTAWLVSCQNHVMTNNHCTWDDADFDTQQELDRMEFQFMYQDSTCGVTGASFEYSFMGGTWLENDHDLDYTLVQAPAGEDPASTYGWLLIDDRLVDIDELIYIVGHPGGRPKEISLYSTHSSDQNNPDGFCEVFSQNEPVCVGGTVGEIGYYCDTEGGSSGSPVLSRVTNKVVALHHCANCPNRGVRIQNIWAMNQAGPNALPACSLFDDAGTVKLDADLYNCGGTVSVEVSDGSLRGAGSQDVTLWSNTESTPETLTLFETTPDSGNFAGAIGLGTQAAVGGDGVLSVAHGDTISVSYIDADDGQGGINVPRQDNATVDCAAPVISNVQVGSVTGSSAVVTWETDEPADSEVSYASTPPPWSTEAMPELVTSHQVDLRGLAACTSYSFHVRSEDGAGNIVTDDNAGIYYSFSTGENNQPAFDSVDVPKAINDNTTITSEVVITEDEPVLDVDVLLNLTHTYDGDLDIFLIGPNGTRVELTTDNGGTGEDFVDTIFDDEAETAITSGSAPFTGRFRPEGTLADLDGISSAGTWTLEITDDAGADQGQLTGWAVILTFEAQPCGAALTLLSHQTEADACSTGGAGAENDRWEVGELVEFSLTVKNTGSAAVSGTVAYVTPVTPGVVMIDDAAGVGDLAPGAVGTTRPPNVIAQLTDPLSCGEMITFQIDVVSNEGSWPASFTQMVGEIVPQSRVELDEDFASGIPATWTVDDAYGDGFTWFADDPTDPAGCGTPDPAAPIAGPWAAVDSGCAGADVKMVEALISPLLDFSADPSVTLEFDHWFEWSPGSFDEIADVDVRSSLTGGEWVNVASWTGASTANAEHVVLDISAQAAGAADVQVRWLYREARDEAMWYVDNVVAQYFVPDLCVNEVCAAPGSSPPPIPDGSGTSQPVRVDRLTPDGGQLSVTWDNQCSPVATKLVYGSLDQVSTHAISGSVCGAATPQTWDAVPAGDLWFILISGDSLGVESSWGHSSEGERNGLAHSATCGSTAKDIAGSCP